MLKLMVIHTVKIWDPLMEPKVHYCVQSTSETYPGSAESISHLKNHISIRSNSVLFLIYASASKVVLFIQIL